MSLSGSIVIEGESGSIVPIHDPEAITRALERLLTEPRPLEQFRAGAQQRPQAGRLDAHGQRLLQVLAP